MACSNLPNSILFPQTCIAFCTNNEVLIALPPAAVAVCALLNFFSSSTEAAETESLKKISNFSKSVNRNFLSSRDACQMF